MSDHLQFLRSRWSIFLERKGVPELFLALITFFVYLRSLGMKLVYDDATLLYIPRHLTWNDIVSLFTQNASLYHGSNFYRPLTGIWQSAVRVLVGESAFGWHASELLLHIGCVLLVFRFAWRLLGDREGATVAAAIFALHPTHVEVVTWCSDAADMLLAMFLLVSALALLRWLKAGGIAWWVLAWAAAAGCCFIKETGVLMPALLIALALAVHAEVSKAAVMLTGFVMAVTSGAFLILRSQILHGFAHALSKVDDRNLVLTEPSAIWFYISHLFFPLNLGPFYPIHFVSGASSRDFVVPVLLLAIVFLLVTAVVLRAKEKRLVLLCVVWALVPLIAPLYLKVFPNFELVHDRYLYIPSIGLGIGVAVLLMRLREVQAWRMPVNVAVVAILVAAAVQTVAYEGVWRSNLTLFQRGLELTPNNDRAMVNLAVAEVDRGNTSAAERLLSRAIELQPDNAAALFDLGNLAAQMNNSQAAVGLIKRALQYEVRAEWLVTLANEEYKLGDSSSAALYLNRALKIDPGARGAHLGLGWIMLNQGQKNYAVREFMIEKQLWPDDPYANYALQVAEGTESK